MDLPTLRLPDSEPELMPPDLTQEKWRSSHNAQKRSGPHGPLLSHFMYRHLVSSRTGSSFRPLIRSARAKPPTISAM